MLELADAERREREEVAKALEAERAARDVAEKKAEAAEKGRANAERKAVDVEETASMQRKVVADTQQSLAAATAVSAPAACEAMKAAMRGEPVPADMICYFEQRKDGTLWPGPGRKAMVVVELMAVGTPEQRAAAKEFGTLASEYMSAIKGKPTPEVLAAKRAEWAKAYPAPVPPAPVVQVVERVVEKLVEKEVIKTVEVPAKVDEAALVAKGEEVGRLKYQVLPQLAGAVDSVLLAIDGMDTDYTSEYVRRSKVQLGGWEFTEKFHADLAALDGVVPEEMVAYVRDRADEVRRIQQLDIEKAAKAIEAKVGGQPTDDFAEEYFTLEGHVQPWVLAAGKAARREMKDNHARFAMLPQSLQEQRRAAVPMKGFAEALENKLRNRLINDVEQKLHKERKKREEQERGY